MDYPKIKYQFVVIFHCYPIFHSIKSSTPSRGNRWAMESNQPEPNTATENPMGGELPTNPK